MATHFQLPAQVTGFHAYYRLNVPAEDVVEALGYTLERQSLPLPQTMEALPWVAPLQARTVRLLTLSDLTSEQARRELLIGPVLTEASLHVSTRLQIEYPIQVAQHLKGTLDYLLGSDRHLLVVEAKHADPARGFVQLAAEMAALDQWTQSSEATLYGAITLGNSWQFACLHRAPKRLVQDIDSYSLPRDLDDIARIVVGVLRGLPPLVHPSATV